MTLRSPFAPTITITPWIATCLMRIEAAKQAVKDLPITPSGLVSLRETAHLFSTHFSTMIEGNRLTRDQVVQVIEKQGHFLGRQRDEKEVLGYFAALEKLELLTESGGPVTDTNIQTQYTLVMAGCRKKVKPTLIALGKISFVTAAIVPLPICPRKPRMYPG